MSLMIKRLFLLIALLLLPLAAQAQGNGRFVVSGGKVIGPDGSTVNLLGVDLYTDNGYAGGGGGFQLPTSISDTTNCLPLLNFYPKLAFVRFQIGTLTTGQLPTAAQLQPYITCLTKRNIVVAFDYHNYGFILTSSPDSEGQTLASIATWEQSIAQANAGNPYLWCMTQNEPDGAASDFNNMILTLYNACRAGGNTAPILLTEWIGGFTNGYFTQSTLNAMTNVIFDHHIYPTCGDPSLYQGCTSDPGTAVTDATLATVSVDESSWAANADGPIPIFLGESGDGPGGNCNGPPPDPSWPNFANSEANAQFRISSLFMGAGFYFHNWDSNSQVCGFTQGNFDRDSPVSYTPAGQIAANLIAAGNGPVGPGGGEFFTITNISNTPINTTFTVSGAIAGVTSVPTLQYENIVNGTPSGTWLALPAGNSVSTTAFSFVHPAVAISETYAVAIRDANATTITSTSNTFRITAPLAIPGAPTLTVGTVTNTAVTFGITPSTTGGVIDNGGYQPQFGTSTFANATFIPVITPGSGSFSALGGAWSISAAGVIAFTGTGGPGTSYNVTQVTLVNGVVWQFNGTSWYSTTTPGTWTGPITASPLTAVTLTNLAAGTAYKIQATESNSAGAGPVSGQITETTTGAAPEAFTINAIANTPVNTAFTVSGNISGVTSAPTLQYENIVNGVASGTWLALPTGFSVTTSTFTFTHPLVASTTTTYAVAVRDAANTSITAISNNFAIRI